MTATHRITPPPPGEPGAHHHLHLPHQSPPPPIRQRDRVLLLIAVFKFVKAALFVVIAAGAFELVRPALMARAQTWVTTLAATYDNGLMKHLVALLQRVTGLTAHRLELVGVAALAYAGLFTTEGVGLWRCRRWAEYLTTVATASLLPFELYELARRLTVPRVAALAINVAVLIYLVVQLRGRDER